MTNIILKKIEPLLIRRLRQRAEQNGRTIEAEIIAILVSVLMPPPPTEPNNLAESNLSTTVKQRVAKVGGAELPNSSRGSQEKTPVIDANDFRAPTGSSLLSNTDRWEGSDFEDCLEIVVATRSQLHT